MDVKTQEALKLAIAFMETLTIDTGIKTWNEKHRKEAIQACIEALSDVRSIKSDLEQPAQKPVAWIVGNHGHCTTKKDWAEKYSNHIKPLYTHPAQPLSDDEIERLADAITIKWHIYDFDMVKFARAIEAAHGIK